MGRCTMDAFGAEGMIESMIFARLRGEEKFWYEANKVALYRPNTIISLVHFEATQKTDFGTHKSCAECNV